MSQHTSLLPWIWSLQVFLCFKWLCVPPCIFLYIGPFVCLAYMSDHLTNYCSQQISLRTNRFMVPQSIHPQAKKALSCKGKVWRQTRRSFWWLMRHICSSCASMMLDDAHQETKEGKLGWTERFTDMFLSFCVAEGSLWYRKNKYPRSTAASAQYYSTLLKPGVRTMHRVVVSKWLVRPIAGLGLEDRFSLFLDSNHCKWSD